MVNVQDREERGVGLQNFPHPPELDEFAHMCAIVSPEVYHMLWWEFPLRTSATFSKFLFDYKYWTQITNYYTQAQEESCAEFPYHYLRTKSGPCIRVLEFSKLFWPSWS